MTDAPQHAVVLSEHQERPRIPPTKFARRSPVPRLIVRARPAIGRLLDLESTTSETIFSVVIRVRDHDLSVRDLAAYLAFADRVYGRLSFESLDKYARRRRSHLRIHEIRRGSVVLILREFAKAASSPYGIVLTGLVLRYLPDIIKAPAAAYRDYEEARYRRAERKHLLQRAEADPLLAKSDAKDVRQIATTVFEAYELERTRLGGPQSFSMSSVESVRLERTEGDD